MDAILIVYYRVVECGKRMVSLQELSFCYFVFCFFVVVVLAQNRRPSDLNIEKRGSHSQQD